MRVLPNKRPGTNSTQDDTAVNDIKFLCSVRKPFKKTDIQINNKVTFGYEKNDQEVSFTTGNNMGTWGNWSDNCATGICGVEV